MLMPAAAAVHHHDPQATVLSGGLAQSDARYPWVTVASVFNFRHDYWMRDAPASIEGNFALVKTDFTPKPAYGAVKGYAAERWLSDAWLSLTSVVGPG